MLTSLVFTLTSESPVKVSPNLGRASRVLFLQLIDEEDPDLAEQLQTPNYQRPYTCSTIWGAPYKDGSLVIGSNNKVHLRYTGLTNEVSNHLQQLAESPPSHLEIGGNILIVQQAVLNANINKWAGRATYEDLSETYLLVGKTPCKRAKICFSSPTSFHRGRKTVPVPLPELVYGSLKDRWNAFSPVPLSDEVRCFAKEYLAVSRYNLSTHTVSGRRESIQIGFVGECQYTALSRDRYWLNVIQLLTDFAFYAGVGHSTAEGMGQARRA